MLRVKYRKLVSIMVKITLNGEEIETKDIELTDKIIELIASIIDR